MRILVTGGHGQCGRRLVVRGAARGVEIIARSRAELDICDPSALASRLVADAPDAVVNAAAFTYVDGAETAREATFAVNATGAGNVARACAAQAIPLLHVSTDYVFDGELGRPYREDDPIGPVGAYGESKAAGEAQVLAAGGTVIRTSWLFAAGGDGFVQRILAGLASRRSIRVVTDRHGCPTWADDLADALLELAACGAPGGILHYTGAGATSRHGFACAIAEAAGIEVTRVVPTTSEDDPRKAARPAATVLDTTKIRALGIVPRPWSIGLAQVVDAERGRRCGRST
ncbi:MAG: dTDP-4-dehydrorhamnose reductase [Myxococcales bacterium]|nr:dTDP-4-dehydrorhamnose reductase [Myxococcales bacterium]